MISFFFGLILGAVLALPLKSFLISSWKELRKIKEEVEKK